MCMSSIDFPELEWNCIYYTDDGFRWSEQLRRQRHDIGIFYMMGKKIQPVVDVGRHSNWPPPIWLTPNLS
ncbi:F-box and DUF domain containing protein [Musa troglodytarum]|uniref:F-box and DUF domain containing protein n=1 Tax=Musa troglodytarum TaxID=320322 RepID=A0A9E7G3T5_9LILI|nr:F-box and DUF domain containing protein [Musa troglodytarum]